MSRCDSLSNKDVIQRNIPETSRVQGGILQAPVSDLEALLSGRDPTKHEALVQRVYDEYISKGKEGEILPQEYRKLTWGVPTSAYRFYSLASKRAMMIIFFLFDSGITQKFW